MALRNHKPVVTGTDEGIWRPGFVTVPGIHGSEALRCTARPAADVAAAVNGEETQ